MKTPAKTASKSKTARGCGVAEPSFAMPATLPQGSRGLAAKADAFAFVAAHNLKPGDVIFLPVFRSDYRIESVHPDKESATVRLRGRFSRKNDRFELVMGVADAAWRLDRKPR